MLRTMHPAEATAELLPLVVDLDGTLLATDSLWELILCFLRKRPFHIFQLIGWVVAGRRRAGVVTRHQNSPNAQTGERVRFNF
jgi:hypothetical protein